MTLLDGKLLMGEPKYLIGGEGGVFAGDYFLGRGGVQIFLIRTKHGILCSDKVFHSE